jgi:hypothetical protein
VSDTDAYAGFEDGFRAGLGELFARHSRELEWLPGEETFELGKQAARSAVAPVLWRQQVGEVWDTSAVTELLQVSRQALNERVRRHSLLGFRSGATTLFPAWQFDPRTRSVRKIVPALIDALIHVPGMDPLTVASWATSPQVELEGERPADLLGREADSAAQVLEAARHTAAVMSQ